MISSKSVVVKGIVIHFVIMLSHSRNRNTQPTHPSMRAAY